MGITRVRARLRSLSLAHQMKPHDEAHAKRVCLLSLVLLLPYFMRFYSPLLVTCVGIAYVFIILPVVMYNKSILEKLQEVIERAQATGKEYGLIIFGYLHRFTVKAWKRQTSVENEFLKMRNISTMLSQVVFFMLADYLFCPGQKVVCLYSLMFYNVIAYCISYAKELIAAQEWSPYVHVSKTTNVKHLAMTTVKLTLEFTKAVTFIITVVFMLLVFGLEQGLENYKPTWTYIILTGFFYMITEKTFVETFPTLLEHFALPQLDNLESLWAPVILRTITTAMSIVLLIPILLFGGLKLFLLGSYINVYLAYRDLKTDGFTLLQTERAVLAKYRPATAEEVSECDDVCAVCLQPMRFARITPCHHMFHGDCLRRCLKERHFCPMCKQELI